MKNGTLATKLILAAILLTVVIYFAVNIATSVKDPFSTALAYQYVSESSITASGYVVRDEEVLPDAGDLVYFSRSEGERVSAGGSVALVCRDRTALDNAGALHAAEEQLRHLEYARSLASGAQTAAKLDEDIEAALMTFHSARSATDLPDTLSSASALRAAVLKRSYAYSGVLELETAIAEQQARVQDLKSAVGPVSTAVRAPRAGLFSGLVDGYETVLTMDSLEDMTPEEYRSIAPAADPPGIGKMIYGSRWAFVTLVRSDEAALFHEGDTVSLRFQTGLDRDLTMKVQSVSADSTGQHLVILTCDDYLQLTTLLRHQNVQLIFHRYSGLRVPRSSVRIAQVPMEDEEGQPLLDEEGRVITEPAAGVFCLWGRTAKLKPVEVVWQEKDHLLVIPAEGVSGQRRLRAGDSVITAAEDLYDGKVIE